MRRPLLLLLFFFVTTFSLFTIPIDAAPPTLTTSVPGTPSPTEAATPTPTRAVLQDEQSLAAWRQDLNYLAEQIRVIHPKPFYRTSESQFSSLVTQIDQDIPYLTRDQIVLQMIQLSAMIDGHTNLPIRQSGLGFHLYPLRLYSFSDGLFVIDAQQPYSDSVGARVVGIGGMDEETVWEKLKPLSHHDNEMSVRQVAPVFHLIPEVLMAEGIIKEPTQPAFVVEKSNGERVTLNPQPVPFSEYLAWSNVVLMALPKQPQPMYLSRVDEGFWFTFLQDSKTLYIQYNQVRSTTLSGETLSAFSQRISEFIGKNEVQCVVVDLRYNGGGDNTTYGPFLNLLRDNPAINQYGKLFVIIGRQTFSAATNFATDLERTTHAIFVGEPTGGSPNLYGDTLPVQLPNSKLLVRVSARYWQGSTSDDKRPWLEPLISAPLSSKDYFARRDPALEAILAFDPSATVTGRTVIFTTEDGAVLSGTLYGRGTRAVVFSNIGDGMQPSWQELPQLVAQRGYLAMTYDWRGLGVSKGARDYTRADKDLAAAIKLVREQGVDQIVLVGGSLGGMASLMNANIPELAGMVVIGSPRTTINFAVAEDQITSITAPKLFVGSKGDLIVKYSETEAMFALAKEPKRIETFEGRAHGTHILETDDHDRLVNLILDFVETVLANHK